MTFSIDAGGPAGPNLDPATGVFTWTPDYLNAGTNTMVLRVTDNDLPALSASGQLRVVVLPGLLASISRNGEAISITFNTLSGHTYRVQYKEKLEDTEWIQLGSDQPASSESLTLPDNLGANTQRFYRVRQVN
jgi:hypothetical protein